MESDLKKKETYHPQLLDLIHKEKEWILREKDEKNFKLVSEEKKLELRLGPPGEENYLSDGNNNSNWLVNNHKVLRSPWIPAASTTSSSPSAFQMKNQQQQHVRQSYLQFQSIPQNLPTIMESSQACSTKAAAAAGELQQSHPEKNASSPSPATVPANPSVNNSSQKRTAPPVVGWPPIRSFRKNLASGSNSSYSKPASEPPSEIQTTKESNGSRKPDVGNKGMFVKINMDGVPIGRKVDLKAYDSYEKLSSAVDELFRGLLAAQRDSPASGNHNKMAEVEEITGLLDGSGEYTLVYEDNEGDRMLVGDVPWEMFVSTVKRLRVLKSSELSALHLGSSRQERAPVDSTVK